MAGSTIAKAYVQIMPSMEGVKGNLTKAFNGEMPSAGASAGNVFGSGLIGKIKGMIAAAGIGKALSSAISAGADMEQLKGGAQKIFDEMDTSTIMADAANAYKDLNMSANQYLSVINDVGATFAATMGDEKGYSVAKTGLQAISDYASGTGKNVDELSQKFTMITRSTSSYQSIADQFSGILPATSAGFLEQAQAAGFLSGEYKNLTEVPVDEYQQAVSEMLKKGTAELGLAGNTAAETATTFSGSFAAMKAAATNLLANLALGEDIGPALQALGDTVYTFLVGNLVPMVGNIIMSLPDVLNSGLSMVIRGLNLVSDNADVILSQGVAFVTQMVSGIVAALPYLAEAALNVVAAFGNAIITTDWLLIGQQTISGLRSSLDTAAVEILGTDGNIVQSVLGAITSGLPGILQSGVSIITELSNGILSNLPAATDAIGSILTNVLQAILNAVPTIWENGFELIENLAGGLMENAPAVMESIASILVDLISLLAEALPELAAKGVELVGELASGLLSNVPSVIGSGADILAELLAEIAGHLPELLQSGADLIAEMIVGLTGAIPDVLTAAGDILEGIVNAFGEFDWLGIGGDIISGIANGIQNGVGTIISAAKTAANSALSAAKKALGIASPSKVMRDQVGKFIPEGIAAGISRNEKTVASAMRDLSDLTTDSIRGNLKLDNTMTFTPREGTGGNASFTFQVYGAPGQSEEELAQIVLRKCQFAVAQKGARLA